MGFIRNSGANSPAFVVVLRHDKNISYPSVSAPIFTAIHALLQQPARISQPEFGFIPLRQRRLASPQLPFGFPFFYWVGLGLDFLTFIGVVLGLGLQLSGGSLQ